jgi:hypothetical protein
VRRFGFSEPKTASPDPTIAPASCHNLQTSITKKPIFAVKELITKPTPVFGVIRIMINLFCYHLPRSNIENDRKAVAKDLLIEH